jgi:hypothetical protein
MNINYSVPCKTEHTEYLYHTSYLIGASSLISYGYQDYATFMYMFCLFLTSINYWNNPSYGIGRNVDLFLAKFINVYFYGTTLLYCDEYSHEMFMNILYHVSFLYFLEHLFIYYQNPKWIVLHMMIHIHVSFFTPFILYVL